MKYIKGTLKIKIILILASFTYSVRLPPVSAIVLFLLPLPEF